VGSLISYVHADQPQTVLIKNSLALHSPLVVHILHKHLLLILLVCRFEQFEWAAQMLPYLAIVQRLITLF
jgi:hypothetical protein